ncbi:16S rRNA (guanine(527)-N(7))-methyltransferase RsmG [Roseinatronobacter domitianus]
MMPQSLDGNVSRETHEKLQALEALVRRWNPRINLVAASTLDDLWARHIVDSMQVFELVGQPVTSWVDLGSGGGFPGIVCAIMALEQMPDCHFTLVESDKRKAAFLLVCQQQFSLNLTVRVERAEQLSPVSADVVSARALAPLPQLLPLVHRHLALGGIALLPKGKNHMAELEAARAEWQFDVTSHDSKTDESARILALKDIQRV